MRNIYDLKQEIQDLKSVREVIATLERISAAQIPPLRNHLETLHEYVRETGRICLNLKKPQEDFEEKSGKIIAVFSADHGLVGGLTVKLVERAAEFIRENPGSRLAVFGTKGRDLLSDFAITPDLFFPALSDKPEISELDEFFSQIFLTVPRFSEISVCAPRFVSVLEQRPEIFTVWPQESGNEETDEEILSENGKTKYSFVDPKEEKIAEFLILKLLKLSMYEKALNGKLCEHAARMTAMSDAGKSAGKIIGDLERQYFKSRQQMITKRLSEVFSAKQSLKQ